MKTGDFELTKGIGRQYGDFLPICDTVRDDFLRLTKFAQRQNLLRLPTKKRAGILVEIAFTRVERITESETRGYPSRYALIVIDGPKPADAESRLVGEQMMAMMVSGRSTVHGRGVSSGTELPRGAL